jgi:hypothetical protein
MLRQRPVWLERNPLSFADDLRHVHRRNGEERGRHVALRRVLISSSGVSGQALGVGFRPAPAPEDFRRRSGAQRAAAAGPALAFVKHSTEWRRERAISVELAKAVVMAGATGTRVNI